MTTEPVADATVEFSLTAAELGMLAAGIALTLLVGALVAWWTLTERARDDAPNATQPRADNDRTAS